MLRRGERRRSRRWARLGRFSPEALLPCTPGERTLTERATMARSEERGAWARRCGVAWLGLPLVDRPRGGRGAGPGRAGRCSGSRWPGSTRPGPSGCWPRSSHVLWGSPSCGSAARRALAVVGLGRAAGAHPTRPTSLGLAWAALVAAAVVAGTTADVMVDGASYGAERRFTLRAPAVDLVRSGPGGLAGRRRRRRRRASAACRPAGRRRRPDVARRRGRGGRGPGPAPAVPPVGRVRPRRRRPPRPADDHRPDPVSPAVGVRSGSGSCRHRRRDHDRRHRRGSRAGARGRRSASRSSSSAEWPGRRDRPWM